MQTSGVMSGLNQLLEWITRLVFLNLLWIFFSLIGLVIFGFFPATAALFAVVRRWALGDMDIPILGTFWDSYKKEFIKSNLLGLLIVTSGIVLVIDYLFLQQASETIINLLYIPFLIVTLIMTCMLLYIFPMYAHYDMNVLQIIKNSFFVMIMNPLSTIVILVGSLGLFFLLSFAPPLMIICSGNILALAITKPANTAFNKINEKHQKTMQVLVPSEENS